MKFKLESLRDELRQAPGLLQMLVWEFAEASESLGVEPVLTRLFEPIPGSSGVHEAHRAADFRDLHLGQKLYSAKQRDFLLQSFNAKYQRIDGKKTLIWHSFQGFPVHFHLQIPADGRVLVSKRKTLKLKKRGKKNGRKLRN